MFRHRPTSQRGNSTLIPMKVDYNNYPITISAWVYITDKYLCPCVLRHWIYFGWLVHSQEYRVLLSLYFWEWTSSSKYIQYFKNLSFQFVKPPSDTLLFNFFLILLNIATTKNTIVIGEMGIKHSKCQV